MPAGVPVEMISPGSSVMTDEISATSSGTGKIRSAVVESWRSASLTQPRTRRFDQSSPRAMHGPDRREGVEPLGPRVVPDLLLQLARRHVVHARHAEDVLGSAFRRHAVRAAADDQPHLGLVVDAPDIRRQFDGLARPDDGRRGLEEEQRLGRQRLPLLGRVRLVVERHRDDLARRHRRQQPLTREPVRDHVARGPLAKQIPDQPAHDAPSSTA